MNGYTVLNKHPMIVIIIVIIMLCSIINVGYNYNTRKSGILLMRLLVSSLLINSNIKYSYIMYNNTFYVIIGLLSMFKYIIVGLVLVFYPFRPI